MRVLFSKGPFIAIFASDPHIIIKAINQNLSSVLRDSNINGHDYMRNIVHLPVFLNSRGLGGARRFLVTSATNGDIACSDAPGEGCTWAKSYPGATLSSSGRARLAAPTAGLTGSWATSFRAARRRG